MHPVFIEMAQQRQWTKQLQPTRVEIYKQTWCYSDMPTTLEVANDREIIVSIDFLILHCPVNTTPIMFSASIAISRAGGRSSAEDHSVMVSRCGVSVFNLAKT